MLLYIIKRRRRRRRRSPYSSSLLLYFQRLTSIIIIMLFFHTTTLFSASISSSSLITLLLMMTRCYYCRMLAINLLQPSPASAFSSFGTTGWCRALRRSHSTYFGIVMIPALLACPCSSCVMECNLSEGFVQSPLVERRSTIYSRRILLNLRQRYLLLLPPPYYTHPPLL